MRLTFAITSLVAMAMAATTSSGMMKQQLDNMQKAIDTNHCEVAKVQVGILLEMLANRAHRGQVHGEKDDVLFITFDDGREATEILEQTKMKHGDDGSQHNVRDFGRRRKKGKKGSNAKKNDEELASQRPPGDWGKKSGKKGGKKGGRKGRNAPDDDGHGNHDNAREAGDQMETMENIGSCEYPNTIIALGDEVSFIRISCGKAKRILHVLHDAIPGIHIGTLVNAHSKDSHDGEHVFYLRADEAEDLVHKLKRAAM